MDQDFKFMKRAEIRSANQGPGLSVKTLIDNDGSHQFSKFVRLEVARSGSEGGYYLFHISADGSCTDTWHSTMEDALEQAKTEYGVALDDWQDID